MLPRFVMLWWQKIALMTLWSFFNGPVEAFKYFASDGDYVQLRCPIATTPCDFSSVGATLTSRDTSTSNVPPVNIGWLYTPLPWDYDLKPVDPAVAKNFWAYEGDHHDHGSPAVEAIWSSPANPPPRLITVQPGGRYSMFLAGDDTSPMVVLQVLNASWTDAGEYTCYCSESFPPVALADHTLVVYGHPLVFAFTSASKFSVPLQSGRLLIDTKSQPRGSYSQSTTLTVSAGSNVTLLCLYSSTVLPIRRFVWIKNGNIEVYVSTDANDAQLRLPFVSDQGNSGNYSCRADLALLFNTTSAFFTLNVVNEDSSEWQSDQQKLTGISSSSMSDERNSLMIIIAVLSSLLLVVVVLVVVAVLVMNEHYRRRERQMFTMPSYGSNGGGAQIDAKKSKRRSGK